MVLLLNSELCQRKAEYKFNSDTPQVVEKISPKKGSPDTASPDYSGSELLWCGYLNFLRRKRNFLPCRAAALPESGCAVRHVERYEGLIGMEQLDQFLQQQNKTRAGNRNKVFGQAKDFARAHGVYFGQLPPVRRRLGF